MRRITIVLFAIIVLLAGHHQVEAKDPQATAYFNQGMALLQQGHSFDSIEPFKKAIEFDPEYIEAYFYLGNAYLDCGKRDSIKEYFYRAISAYQKVIELNPKSTSAYHNIGTVYIHLQNYSEAIKYFNTVLLYSQSDKSVYYNLGISWWKLGDNSKALQFSRKSLEIDSRYAAPYYLMGVIYKNLGDRNLAIENFRKAAELGNSMAEKQLTALNASTGTTKEGTSKEVSSKLQSFEYAFKTFILWVPGTSYSIDNYDRQTSTLYISAGTLPKSTITINENGTYTWNSAWDGRIIEGEWVAEGDGLNLLRGQEGKTWRLAKGDGKHEDIFLMDGHIWYSGKAVTVKEQ